MLNQDKIESFFLGCQAISNKSNHASITEHNRQNPDKEPLPLSFHDQPWSIKYGKRYAKIYRGWGIHCFIDLDNGDVLKAASSKAPAKHARGNILDEHNGLKYMTQFGPAYLR
jgi:hypothetical protein